MSGSVQQGFKQEGLNNDNRLGRESAEKGKPRLKEREGYIAGTVINGRGAKFSFTGDHRGQRGYQKNLPSSGSRREFLNM